MPNPKMTRREPLIRSTTVLAVRKGSTVSIGADGQVTMNNVAIKHTAKKVRTLMEGKVVAGFAGSTADALTLFEKLEGKLEAHGGNLRRAAVELAKEWRTDRFLRRLEALMIAIDKESILLLSGNGDVIEPDEGVIAVGSGSGFATAAARAMMDREDLDSRQIVQRALTIAGDMCVFTNHQFQIETLENK